MDSVTRIVKVCVAHTWHDYFDYACADHKLCIGGRVWVPLYNKLRMGIVLDIREDVSIRKLKNIDQVIDNAPILSTEILLLCQWMSKYYHAPLSEIIPLAIPKRYRLGRAKLPQAPKILIANTTNLLELHPEQMHALHMILAAENQYQCFLLHGVTGSGKPKYICKLSRPF